MAAFLFRHSPEVVELRGLPKAERKAIEKRCVRRMFSQPQSWAAAVLALVCVTGGIIAGWLLSADLGGLVQAVVIILGACVGGCLGGWLGALLLRPLFLPALRQELQMRHKTPAEGR